MLVNDTHNIVQDNVDLTKCLARKACNLHEQCKNKKKGPSEFCGIHLKCISVRRIDQPLSSLLTKKKKFRVLKNPKILSYQYLEKMNFEESKIRISDVKYTLIYYKLPISKNENLKTLIFHLRNLNYYKEFLSQILVIQNFYRKNKINRTNRLRGPSLFNRENINNEYDFLTCENVADIPNDKFFSYKDLDGFIYAFNIGSIKYLIEHRDNNPYNRNLFPDDVIRNFKKLVKLEESLGKDLNFKFDEPVSKYQKMKQKCVEIFQRFDHLEHYSQVDWFLNIPLNNLKKLYAEIEDIWNYRAMLSKNAQKKYVKDGKAFQYSISSINKINNILKLQKILLNEFHKFAFDGETREDCITSTYWILTGLTLVSPEAAAGLPYLVQSNAFN